MLCYGATLTSVAAITEIRNTLKATRRVLFPLAQKIVAMNIDISELLVFDSAVNELAKRYNLSPSVAALRLFNDIKDYNKIGGLEKGAV
ncbi:MAG: hypothetical protein ACJ71R_13375 [Nitrososphaeraceae archaeon]